MSYNTFYKLSGQWKMCEVIANCFHISLTVMWKPTAPTLEF